MPRWILSPHGWRELSGGQLAARPVLDQCGGDYDGRAVWDEMMEAVLMCSAGCKKIYPNSGLGVSASGPMM